MTTRIDEGARARTNPRRIFNASRRETGGWEGAEKKKKENRRVDDRTEKRREPGLAEHGQKARVYAHKVDLAPLNMHIGLGRRRS